MGFPRLLLPRLLPRSVARRLARYLPQWDGHNIRPEQVFVPRLKHALNATAEPPTNTSTTNAVPLLPWGFVPQSVVRERVAPLRTALVAAPKKPTADDEDDKDEEGYYTTALLGTHQTNPEVAELFGQLQADFAEGARQAYLAITSAFLSRRDFTEMSYCSPDLSCFLNHVRASYSKRNVEPQLTVHNVTARLKALRLEHGFVCDNRHFLGLFGKREAWHHFLVGAAGPEWALIEELSNGDFPRRLAAEVEFEVQETFQLVGWDSSSSRHNTDSSDHAGAGEEVTTRHFFTFESDFLRGTEPEWQVSNINDAIKSPSLHSLLMMCGATTASTSS